MEPATLRLSPRASHPTVTGSARRGRGQAIEHGPGTTAQLTSVDLQSGSSLVSCDIASHRALQGAGPSALLSTQTREDARPPCCRAKAGLRADAAEAVDGVTTRVASLANLRCGQLPRRTPALVSTRYFCNRCLQDQRPRRASSCRSSAAGTCGPLGCCLAGWRVLWEQQRRAHPPGMSCWRCGAGRDAHGSRGFHRYRRASRGVRRC